MPRQNTTRKRRSGSIKRGNSKKKPGDELLEVVRVVDMFDRNFLNSRARNSWEFGSKVELLIKNSFGQKKISFENPRYW